MNIRKYYFLAPEINNVQEPYHCLKKEFGNTFLKHMQKRIDLNKNEY